MIVERLTLTTLLLSSTLTGFSFYRFYENRLRARFRRYRVDEHRASLPNGEVRYWAGGRGDGRPLLLVHGFGGDALFGWSEQVRLASHRFLIAPDLLWFGESHSSHDDATLALQADTLAQLLDHLAVDSIDVVGISYGGFVAGELANRFPDRVRRLVIVDSPGHTYSLEDYHAMLDRLGLDSIAEMVVPESPRGVQRLLKLAYHRPPPVPMFVARDIYAHMFVRWKRQKIRLLDHLLTMAPDVDLTEYRFPRDTLILWGSNDELFPVHLAERLARAVGPQCEVEILPRTNHAPNMERPALFNERVLTFLDRPDAVAKATSGAA